jgi:hypothetical protein
MGDMGFYCGQNLDIQGDFLIYLTSITDIGQQQIFRNNNRLPNDMCGDVSPKTTKVIMRQGNLNML